MKAFDIRRFSGIETKFSREDQDRGTLRRADNVLIAPQGAISSGPTWGVAWGYTNLATSVATALSGADPALVHFARVSDAAGNTLLVAYDMAAAVFRGAWWVAMGTSAPDFSSAVGVTITATNNAVYRDKTAALNWFGQWIGNRLFLGNGTDGNLVWTAGALALLTAANSSTADPSKSTIPACTAFAEDASGHIYAAGNAANPLRVFVTDKPSQQFPTITGLLTSDRSFVLLRAPNARATSITALSPGYGGVIAHLGAGGAVWLRNPHGNNDGQDAEQRPIGNVAGAANPACAANAEATTTYLGADFELYGAIPREVEGYNVAEPRPPQIETWKAAGQWNRLVTRSTVATLRPFVVEDTANTRFWVSAPLALRNLAGLWCYDHTAHAITGPFAYPALAHIAPLLRQDLPGATQPEANGSPFVVVGISQDGALLYADLGKVGELALDAPGTALGSSYEATEAQPTPTAGLTCIGVYNSGQSFARVDSAGRVDLLADAWGEWVSNGTTVPGGITIWFNNASLALVEVADDFGAPAGEKDFCELRLHWRPSQRAYAAVFVESGQQRDANYIGLAFPDAEQLVPIAAKGVQLRTRLALVVFNGAPATLTGLTIGYLPGTLA